MVQNDQNIGFPRLGGRKWRIGAVVQGLRIYAVRSSQNQYEKEAEQEGKQYVFFPQ
jgi:hypothetical protein